MRLRRWCAIVGFVALLVTACASGSDSPTSTAVTERADASSATATESGDSGSGFDGADDEPSGAAEPDDPDAPASIERTDNDETVNDANTSPIFDALGFDPNDRLAVQTEFNRQAEELVRRCMADAGFEYVPSLPAAAPSNQRQWELQATISREQFLAEYGYGISTLLELDFFEDGILAFTELVLGPPPSAARSEGEQEAYEIALYGDTIQGLTAEEAQDRSADQLAGFAQPGSCRSNGYDEADNSINEKFDGLFTVLGDEYAQLFERVENDPRIRDATAAWQTCMAGFGYSYENTQDIVDEVFDQANDLRAGFQSSPEALAIFAAAGEQNLAGMNADDRYSFLEAQGAFQGFALVPSLQVELDALIEKELTVAGHDWECADGDLFESVFNEYAQEFVETHAEQLNLIANGEA